MLHTRSRTFARLRFQIGRFPIPNRYSPYLEQGAFAFMFRRARVRRLRHGARTGDRRSSRPFVVSYRVLALVLFFLSLFPRPRLVVVCACVVVPLLYTTDNDDDDDEQQRLRTTTNNDEQRRTTTNDGTYEIGPASFGLTAFLLPLSRPSSA